MIDGMVEEYKVLNVKKQTLQEHVKELQSKGKAYAEPASQGNIFHQQKADDQSGSSLSVKKIQSPQ